MSRDFVLLFAGSNLIRFRELARSCAVAGLLREFLLVDENQQAELFIGTLHKPVPYLNYLATRFKGTRSVTAATIAVGAVANDELKRRRSEFVHDLKQRCADKDIPFRDGTISVPLANGELSPSFIEPSWTFNLVGVPEDWTGESQQIGIPLTGDSAEDIAFNIAATITGLWMWTESPPLDHGVLREHVEQPPLRLIRATTRVVPLGDVVDTIAYAAMDPRNNWPTPEGCEKHPQQDVLVRATLDALTTSKAAALSLREAKAPQLPQRHRLGILDSIVLYFSHLVANLLGQPAKAWQRAKERAIRWAENYVQRKTFQGESQLVVRYGGRLRDEDFVGDGTSRAEAIVDAAGIGVPAVEVTANRWRVISRAVLGAIDGSDSDSGDYDFAPPKFRDQVAVAESRSTIGPNPFEPGNGEFCSTLKINGEEREFYIRAYDVIRFREIRDELVKANKRSEGASATDVEAAREEADLAINQDQCVETRIRLDAWHKPRSRSLIWAIGEYLDTQIQVAAKKLGESLQEVESIPRQIAEAEAKQKKKVNRGKWLSRLLILLLIFSIALPFMPPIAAAGVLAGGALATAIFFLPYLALLGVLSAWLANARTQVREEFKLDQLETFEEQARASRHHFWREIHRLEYCYAHFLDWAEILTTVVWKPFGTVLAPSQPTVVTPPVKALSFQFASPVFDSEAVLSEQISMRSRVAGRGWLNDIFNQLLQLSEENYNKLTAADGVDADPYFDTSLNNEFVQVGDKRLYKPRRQFLEDLRSGRPQQNVADSKMREIRDIVAARELEHLVAHVDAHAFVEIEGNREEREVQDFLAPILGIKDLPVFERFVERGGPNSEMKVGTVYWSSSGFRSGISLDENKYTLQGTSASSVSSGALATSRVDISAERFRPSELTFIQRPVSKAPESIVPQPRHSPDKEDSSKKKID